MFDKGDTKWLVVLLAPAVKPIVHGLLGAGIALLVDLQLLDGRVGQAVARALSGL